MKVLVFLEDLSKLCSKVGYMLVRVGPTAIHHYDKVSCFFTSKQILPFDFAEQNMWLPGAWWRGLQIRALREKASTVIPAGQQPCTIPPIRGLNIYRQLVSLPGSSLEKRSKTTSRWLLSSKLKALDKWYSSLRRWPSQRHKHILAVYHW